MWEDKFLAIKYSIIVVTCSYTYKYERTQLAMHIYTGMCNNATYSCNLIQACYIGQYHTRINKLYLATHY